MSTYTPSAVALTTLTLPADGENIYAADVNGPLQEVADGVAFLQAAKADTITATVSWTCPAGVTSVIVEGCGGGGGGGAGGAGTATTDRWSTGGGGGGGAPIVTRALTVVPTTAYTLTIGAGGASDADGANTTFGSLATFVGGGKGDSAGAAVQSTNAVTPLVVAGGSVRGATFPVSGANSVLAASIAEANGLCWGGAATGRAQGSPGRSGSPHRPTRAEVVEAVEAVALVPARRRRAVLAVLAAVANSSCATRGRRRSSRDAPTLRSVGGIRPRPRASTRARGRSPA